MMILQPLPVRDGYNYLPSSRDPRVSLCIDTQHLRCGKCKRADGQITLGVNIVSRNIAH